MWICFVLQKESIPWVYILHIGNHQKYTVADFCKNKTVEFQTEVNAGLISLNYMNYKTAFIIWTPLI